MTSPRRLTGLAERLPDRGDDRGSLAMAMIAILVAAMLGGLILPMVVAQNRSTRFDITRVHSLHAAQAGVDVVAGQIRASGTSTAADGTVVGDPTLLPCTSASPVVGSANGTGNGTYSVTVDYFATSPSGTAMKCTSGYGTYAGGTATPRYAVITSTGTDSGANSGSTGRTLESTYVFKTDDTVIPGGQVRLTSSGGSQWCMDAGSTPGSGTQLVLAACSVSTPLSTQQVFAYRSDLSIQLVSSVTTAAPGGLCVDAAVPHAVGAALVLRTCGIVAPTSCTVITTCSPYNQQWTLSDVSHLAGAKSDRSTTDGFCINAAAQAVGTALTLATCAGGATDVAQSWSPAPSAGAGMAGAAYDQLVNYAQYADCLDVPGGSPGYAYLIVYPCSQNPNPANVSYNQKFAPTPALTPKAAVNLLKTTASGTTYCLTSPLSVGGYVRVTAPCPASPSTTSAYQWTVNQTQDANGNSLPDSVKYTVVDAGGRCLAPGLANDLYNNTNSKAIVTTCDGSTGQKWNAPASLDSARIVDTHELQ